MNKSFYTFANAFLILTVMCGILTGIIHFSVGSEVFKLEAFANWYLAFNIVYLASTGFILKYYYHKKYWLAFSAGIIAALASVFLIIIFYALLLYFREFEKFYEPALLFAQSAGILHAVTLLLPDASKRPWLKAAGILSIISGTILVGIYIWYTNSEDIQLRVILDKTYRWVSWISGLIPVMFIMNFRIEERLVKEDGTYNSRQMLSETWLGFATVLAYVSIAFLGYGIANQSYGRNLVTTKAKLLAQPFEARLYVNSKGDSLPYRFMKPLNYDPAKSYPLVVCLHHGGTHGTDNVRQIEGSWAAYLSKDVNRKKYQAFLFAPQCPREKGWGGFPRYPGIDSLVFEAISSLEQEFLIDAKRRYVLGVSGGGYGSWHFISTRPKMFAAAIPICGGGNPALAHNIADGNVSVWAFHGEKDRMVPVTSSRDMIAGIKKAGGNPRYTEYPYTGHNMGDKVENTPGLMDWFFAQKRED